MTREAIHHEGDLSMTFVRGGAQVVENDDLRPWTGDLSMTFVSDPELIREAFGPDRATGDDEDAPLASV